MVKAEMKIQQMAFMIVAVFAFFIMVGLFFIMIQGRDIKSSYVNLQRTQAINALETITNLPELNCDAKSSLCLDEDKLISMMRMSDDYSGFWTISSIEVYKIYPAKEKEIVCPNTNCNYYPIYKSSQTNTTTYATYVNICKQLSQSEIPYKKCELGKILVGVKQ